MIAIYSTVLLIQVSALDIARDSQMPAQVIAVMPTAAFAGLDSVNAKSIVNKVLMSKVLKKPGAADVKIDKKKQAGSPAMLALTKLVCIYNITYSLYIRIPLI